MNNALDLRAIYRARQAIHGVAWRTPLVFSPALSQRSGGQVYLKLENQQATGAFKVRGAANALSRLSEAERANGVITVSTGNHGRAVAFVAKRLGMRAVICAPTAVLPHKVAAIRALGAEVRRVGADQDEAEAAALVMAREEGLTWVSAFDDLAVIAGQGTIGLEILEDLPDVEMVIAPLSGGGLLGGIAFVIKRAGPDIITVGASMDRGPVMVASLAAGRPVQLPEEPTLADSLMGGIGLENRYTFRLIQETVDQTVLLSEAEIGQAMVFALQEEHQVVEGGGAVGIGAVLHGKLDLAGKTVAVVVSGGNVSMDTLTSLMTTTA